MKANIGSNATRTPPATATTGYRGRSSRSARNANTAVSAPSSAETSRIAVSCDQIDQPCVAQYGGASSE